MPFMHISNCRNSSTFAKDSNQQVPQKASILSRVAQPRLNYKHANSISTNRILAQAQIKSNGKHLPTDSRLPSCSKASPAAVLQHIRHSRCAPPLCQQHLHLSLRQPLQQRAGSPVSTPATTHIMRGAPLATCSSVGTGTRCCCWCMLPCCCQGRKPYQACCCRFGALQHTCSARRQARNPRRHMLLLLLPAEQLRPLAGLVHGLVLGYLGVRCNWRLQLLLLLLLCLLLWCAG